ncbi:MAG: hypothetical protein HND48_04770 [Chloroflexi bacterium]|nr:hypothetical protein [Chloroflexota bacterium]
MTSNTNSQNLQAFRWVLIAAGVAITFATLWAIRSILLLTLASVVLVVLVTMPVRFLARYNVRRGPGDRALPDGDDRCRAAARTCHAAGAYRAVQYADH